MKGWRGRSRIPPEGAKARFTRVSRGLAPQVYSSQFLESVRIASTGTVKKAVRRLESDELVYEWQRSWRFVDPFFREWVRRKI